MIEEEKTNNRVRKYVDYVIECYNEYIVNKPKAAINIHNEVHKAEQDEKDRNDF
jgi:hypothetical protein